MACSGEWGAMAGDASCPDSAQQPRVAVLLAACQGEPWLDAQISSILAAENVSVTLFVSLDPSTDGSLRILQAWQRRDQRVILLPAQAPSGGAARNFFRLLRDVDAAGFDFVALADQDDVWMNDKLARACTRLHAEEAAAYSSNVLAVWPDGRESLIRKNYPLRSWDFVFEGPGPGCSFVLIASVAQQLRSFIKLHWDVLAELGYHDWFIYAFVRSRNLPWLIDAYPGVRYRQHHANVLGANQGWRAAWSRWQKIRSGWGLAQAALLVDILGLTDQPFIRQWRTQGLCWLAWQARQCRRRPRDQFFFFLMCLILCLRERHVVRQEV